MPRFFLEIATPVDLLQIAVGAHHAHDELPPPGMGRGYDVAALARIEAGGVASLDTLLYVTGEPPDGTEDDWYWGTLGDFLLELPDLGGSVLARILTQVARVAGRLASDALTIPLVKKGTANGQMKWLRVTHRGILGGGVEQFQWKLDLGMPGSDPDTTQDQRDTLASDLKGVFTTAWNAHYNSWDNEVKYSEIGVAQMEQTSATDKEGNGGNQSTNGVTSWSLFPLVTGAITGGGLGPALPYEVALAVSLQTDYRGPSGRGRLYLPPPATSVMVNGGVFSDACVTEAGLLIHNYIEAIKDATPYTVLVVSPRRLVLHEVTSISVGKVPDSQRRRRRSQSEARVVSAVA